MKKLLIISMSIFLTGLFAGIFFSYGIADENKSYLANLIVTNITGLDKGFLTSLGASLITNLSIAFLMLVAIYSKLLSPLPLFLLLYKSFALGFSNSLLYISQAILRGSGHSVRITESAAFYSLTNIVPQNMFFIPAFIVLATVTFKYSHAALLKSKRSSRERKDLHKIILICFVTITVGCIIEAIVL